MAETTRTTTEDTSTPRRIIRRRIQGGVLRTPTSLVITSVGSSSSSRPTTTSSRRRRIGGIIIRRMNDHDHDPQKIFVLINGKKKKNTKGLNTRRTTDVVGISSSSSSSSSSECCCCWITTTTNTDTTMMTRQLLRKKQRRRTRQQQQQQQQAVTMTTRRSTTLPSATSSISSTTTTMSHRHHRREEPPLMRRRILPLLSSSSTAAASAAVASWLPFLRINQNDQWGNWGVLLCISSIAPTISKTTVIGRLLGGPVSAMAITFVLSSIGIIQPGGTIYAKQLQYIVLQFATPLILLGADFKNCIKRCGPLIISFLVASMATLIACIIGWIVIGQTMLLTAFNNDIHIAAGIAAALLAKNIGGGINYIAICQTLSLPQTTIAAGLCIDNIFALLYFPITSILANKYHSQDPISPTMNGIIIENDDDDNEKQATATAADNYNDAMENATQSAALVATAPIAPPAVSSSVLAMAAEKEKEAKDVGGNTNNSNNNITSSSSSSSVQDITTSLSLSALLLWMGEIIGRKYNASLPACTALTVLFASGMIPYTSRWIQNRPSIRYMSDSLGTACLYIFFATAGAPGISIANSVRSSLIPLSLYLTILYSVHGFILAMIYYSIFVGSSRRKNKKLPSLSLSKTSFAIPQRLLVSSSAAIGGPATAIALAQSSQWNSLQVPSLLVGNIGYAIATFIGLLFYKIVVVQQ